MRSRRRASTTRQASSPSSPGCAPAAATCAARAVAAARRRPRAAAPPGGRGRAQSRARAPQAVFKRLFGLLEAISRRSAYLALLIEHPPVLPRLAQLMGASSWAADYLTRHPLLLDELLDARVLLAEPDWDAWRAELARAWCATTPATRSGRWTRCAISSTRRRFACSRRISPGSSPSSASPITCPRWPTSSSRRRSPRSWIEIGGTRRRAAEVRHRRLRQARRQGAGLRVRSRPRVPARRPRRVGAPSATRGSRSGSSPGSPRRRPRERSTTSTSVCARTASPVSWCPRSRRSAATSASTRGRGSTRR